MLEIKFTQEMCLVGIKKMKNIDKKISIIIPCYNVEKYVEECLDSILNQSFKNVEIICVDDGSTDGTLKILKTYEKKHKNVKVLTQKNKSAGAARNNGLKVATGEFVLFMDSDDFLQPSALQILIELTKKESADIYFFNFLMFDDITKEIKPQIQFKGYGNSIIVENEKVTYCKATFQNKKEFLTWSYVAPWNKLYNRKFVVDNKLKFDEIFSTNDRTFFFSSLVKSKEVVFLDACLINYRINNSGSLTGTYNQSKFINRKLAYESSLRFIDKEDALLNETFFKVTIADFVSFFQKTKASDKFKVFKDTLNFFKTIDVSNIKCIKANTDKSAFWYNFFIESDYLLDLEEKNIVPVVFATNEKYAPYLSVAIESLKSHINKDKFYDIYIFNTSLTDLTKQKLMTQSIDNVHIRIVDMNSLVNGLPLYAKSHFSVEMYYRILIPEVLWHYKKVLYLDCDICLLRDANDLYETNVEDYILSAIHNRLNEDMYKFVVNGLKIKPEEYFNSGILVMNTDNFKLNNIKSQCFDILAQYKKLPCPDQDILNLSCNGKVLYLDEFWNFQCQNSQYTTEYKYQNLKHINIIHYTTGNKPWNTKNLPLGEFFWKYAKETPFFESIISIYLESTLKLSIKTKEVSQDDNRNLINEKNQYKLKVKEKMTFGRFISFPFRSMGLFFKNWRLGGFKYACQENKTKFSYAINRLKKKVDANNNPIIVVKDKKNELK